MSEAVVDKLDVALLIGWPVDRGCHLDPDGANVDTVVGDVADRFVHLLAARFTATRLRRDKHFDAHAG